MLRSYNSAVHLPSMKKIFQYRYACLILCNAAEVFTFEHRRYISAMEHIRMLILISYVLLIVLTHQF